MKFREYSMILFGAALLSGCSGADDMLWPSLSGSDPAGPPKPVTATASAQTSVPTRIDIPAPKEPTFTAPQQVASTPTPTGQSSGTFVGRKVTQMRTDLGWAAAACSRPSSGDAACAYQYRCAPEAHFHDHGVAAGFGHWKAHRYLCGSQGHADADRSRQAAAISW